MPHCCLLVKSHAKQLFETMLAMRSLTPRTYPSFPILWLFTPRI